MDALEDGDLVLPQLERAAFDGGTHLPGKLKLRDIDLFATVQHPEVPVEQVHIQVEGGLVVDLPLPVSGHCLRVHRLEVVVHGDGVGGDAHLLELGLDFLGRGGLAGSGGAAQKDNPALGQVVRDLPGRLLNLPVVGRVALLYKALGVAADRLVDLLE